MTYQRVLLLDLHNCVLSVMTSLSVFWIVLPINVLHSQVFGPHNYCTMESFNASCAENQVIVMRTARYGRMKIGRCVKGNYGNLGCSTDVLDYVDSKCSGRNDCRFGVPDPILYETKPCPDDFTSYMEASYECVGISNSTRHNCQRNRNLMLYGNSGRIASVVAEDHGLGTVHCPWNIQVGEGQRINLTMMNFARGFGYSPGAISSSTRHHDLCYEVARILEGKTRSRSLTICTDEPRIKTVYISSTNLISLYFVNRRILSNLGAFLFKYEAFGCPEIHPRANQWIEKDGYTIIVSCNGTEDTWTLTCQGSMWVGEIGNCTPITTQEEWSINEFFVSGTGFPHGIIIVIAIGVVLGVVFGGVLLVCVVMQFRKSREKPRSSSEQYHTSPLVVENKPTMAQSGGGGGTETGGSNPPPWTPALSYQTESTDIGSIPDTRVHVTSPQILRTSQESVYYRNYNTLPLHAEVTEDGTTIYSCTTLPAQRTFSTFKPPPEACYHLYERSEPS